MVILNAKLLIFHLNASSVDKVGTDKESAKAMQYQIHQIVMHEPHYSSHFQTGLQLESC